VGFQVISCSSRPWLISQPCGSSWPPRCKGGTYPHRPLNPTLARMCAACESHVGVRLYAHVCPTGVRRGRKECWLLLLWCRRSTSLVLAILHPRKLSVYTLQAVGNSYLQLSKLYEHALEHTAANLTCGPFGGVSGAGSSQACTALI
jgi:hypothetical protein